MAEGRRGAAEGVGLQGGQDSGLQVHVEGGILQKQIPQSEVHDVFYGSAPGRLEQDIGYWTEVEVGPKSQAFTPHLARSLGAGLP